MAEAGVAFADLAAIAVTEGPGLAGALLVGITYAKALALGLGKPLIAVNHLEGHIHAVLMEVRQRNEAPEMPLLALVVSGGHTHLYLAEEGGRRVRHYRNMSGGRTQDDAAGEAFDKVAKLLGLGYPGGPWMDALAAHGNPHAVEFRFQPIKLKGSHAEGNSPSAQHFSFSGIKTAVLRYVQSHAMQERVEARRTALTAVLKENPALKPTQAMELLPWLFDAETLDLIASFQHAVVGNLLRQTWAAAEAFEARGIVVSGGVAANSELRRRFQAEADRRGIPVAFPTLAMSTDNAAMIAAAAWPKFVAGNFAGDGLIAVPQLRLG